jgi:general secretion pathway protein A
LRKKQIGTYLKDETGAFMKAVAPAVHGPQSLLDFFCLRGQPFGFTPDPAYLYLSPDHERALNALSLGIRNDRGFLALVAEPGMGKTTLLHKLMEDLADSARVVFLFQTQCDIRQFFEYVLAELSVDASGMGLVSMHRRLNEMLFEEMLAGRRFVLIVDEAQNLSAPVLEMLRTLSNFETPQSKLLQIVLAGQPGLITNLASPSFTQLWQRITFLNSLQPLDLFEIAQYVDFRLSVAGLREGRLFTLEALREIELASEGIPRNINSICFDAMLLAFDYGERTIGREVLRDVISKRRLATEPPERPFLVSAVPVVQLLQPSDPDCAPAWEVSGSRSELVSVAPHYGRDLPHPQFESPDGFKSSQSSVDLSGQIQPDTRRFEMTNTGVARATIPAALGGRTLDLEIPQLNIGERARPDVSLSPSEEFLRLAARMLAQASQTDRVFLFAGVTGSEGVDDVSAGVACALAAMGKGAVLLVDADLRSPSLHSRFGVALSPGLSELHDGAITRDSFVGLGNGNVTLLSAGERTDPLSLFSSRSFETFLANARDSYRFVVLKAPALLAFAEVDLLVQSADGVVMVVPSGKQTKTAVAQAKRALGDLKAKTLGAVLCTPQPK